MLVPHIRCCLCGIEGPKEHTQVLNVGGNEIRNDCSVPITRCIGVRQLIVHDYNSQNLPSYVDNPLKDDDLEQIILTKVGNDAGSFVSVDARVEAYVQQGFCLTSESTTGASFHQVAMPHVQATI